MKFQPTLVPRHRAMHHQAVRMPIRPRRRHTHRAVQITGQFFYQKISRKIHFQKITIFIARQVRPIHQLVQATHRRHQTPTIHRAVHNTGKNLFDKKKSQNSKFSKKFSVLLRHPRIHLPRLVTIPLPVLPTLPHRQITGKN